MVMPGQLKFPGLRHNTENFKTLLRQGFFIEIFKIDLDFIKTTIDKINIKI